MHGRYTSRNKVKKHQNIQEVSQRLLVNLEAPAVTENQQNMYKENKAY